jgi:hypothetical protein
VGGALRLGALERNGSTFGNALDEVKIPAKIATGRLLEATDWEVV